MDGILVVDKPRGLTSRQVVTHACKILGASKAGHAGTLDPLATGVLVVCLGRGTLISRYLARDGKSYRVAALLGISTDTYDIWGKVLSRKGVVGLSSEAIEETLRGFEGSIMQDPPPYSAVKYKGKPLYSYARRGLEVSPAPRKVNVGSIEIVSLETGDAGTLLTFMISCGSGTYVRSIVNDIGRRLGCGACVYELRRISSGRFAVDEAVSLDMLESVSLDKARGFVHTLEYATEGLPTVSVSSEGSRRVRLGEPLRMEWVKSEVPVGRFGTFRVLDGRGSLLAIYGPPRSEDGTDIAGRAVRVITPSRVVSEKDEAA